MIKTAIKVTIIFSTFMLFACNENAKNNNDVPIFQDANQIVGEIASTMEDSSPTEKLLQTADISTDTDTAIDQENYAYDADIVTGTRQSQIGFMASSRIVDVIGWSYTGLFAYRTTWDAPAIPASGYKLIIFDAVTNNEIVSDLFSWPSPPWHEPDALPPSPETRIAETRTRWNELLSSYGIAGYVANPVEEITEGGYNFFGGNGFDVWFDYKRIWDEVTWELNAEIGNRQKTIYSGHDFMGVTHARKIIGYYKSPHENRIVILTLTARRGFFIYEPEIEVNFFGLNLDFD